MRYELPPQRPTRTLRHAGIFLGVILTLLGTPLATHAGLVTTEADDGTAGTLRAQIATANPGETISFAPALVGKTIVLTAGQLVLDRDLTLVGPGADSLAISGNRQRAFFVAAGVTATLQGITVRDGYSPDDGGGILNAGTLTVRACTLTGNTTRVQGGAISSTGTLTVEGCTLRGNATAPAANFDYGGAIHNSGTLVIRNSVLTGNSAFWGSAILNSGSAVLVNTTLSANQGYSGPFRPSGALQNYGTATLAFCTLIENEKNGILNQGVVHARNCLFARNPWGNVWHWTSTSNFTTSGVNLSDDDTFPGATLFATAQLAIAPLADYGGTVMTHALLPGSVAIDAASDCLDVSGNALPEDARGYPRAFGGACDVGAYEAQAQSDLPATSPDVYAVDEDGSLQVAAPGLLINDNHPHNAALAVSAATAPSHGTLVVRADGSFTYTPAPDYHGSDAFTYYVTDGLHGAATGSVSLTVNPVNDAPTLAPLSLRSLRDVPVAITVTASDVEGDPFTFGMVDPPSHGVLSGTLPNLTYTPNPGYTGRDRFTCRATDSHGDFSTMDVSIDVQPYTIWNGPRTQVTVSNGDWGAQAPIPDTLTPGVVIGADLNYGMPYNSVLEPQSDIFSSPQSRSPAGTEWALGTTADVASLQFRSLENLFFQTDYALAGRNLVVHLISEGILVDLKFTYFDGDSYFSYERSTPFVRMSLNGSPRMSVPCCQPFTDPGATALDLAGNPLEVSVTGEVDVTTGGSYRLTYTATDSQGNTGTLHRTVDVGAVEVTVHSGFTRAGGGAPFSNHLTEGRHCFEIHFYNSGGSSGLNLNLPAGVAYACPALNCPNEIRAASPAGSCGAVVNFDLPTLTDPCLDLTVACTPAPGSLFPVGSTPVTCEASRADGTVVARCTFNVVVVDATPPSLTCPGNISVVTSSSQGMAVNYPSAIATDTCSNPRITYSKATGTVFPLGLTTVTTTAVDEAGNAAACSFQVRVVYAWSGFLNPIAPDGSSVLKTGTTVGIKFALTGASAGIPNAQASFRFARRDNSTGATGTVTTAGQFRYDPTKAQYLFNWNTRGLPDGNYEVQIDLGDGVSRRAQVRLDSKKN
jgi:predicted outer membrane repeat protein